MVNAKKKKKKDDLNAKLENYRGKNEKEYWNCLKNLAGIQKKDEKLPEEVKMGDRVERGEKRKEVWNEAFCKLGKFEANDKDFDIESWKEIVSSVVNWEEKVNKNRKQADKVEQLDREIDKEEIEKALSKMKNGKAAGDDECINEILKAGGEEMKESIWVLFQKMWKEEKIPIDWARGIIVPIFKDGEKKNVDNYRGITLLSVVGKFFTSILNNRITDWLESNKKIVEEQGGFRENRSTSEQIFILRETIEARKKKRKKTFCCFLDIKKAYDTVFREGLWAI